MTAIKRARERLALELRDVAAAAGISPEDYYDMETLDDEIRYAVSVGTVVRVARILKVAPSSFYGAMPTGAVSVSELAALIRERLRTAGTSLAEFEEKIGWSLGTALDNPKEFSLFNADGLQATCDAVGVNWLDVLDGMNV